MYKKEKQPLPPLGDTYIPAHTPARRLVKALMWALNKRTLPDLGGTWRKREIWDLTLSWKKRDNPYNHTWRLINILWCIHLSSAQGLSGVILTFIELGKNDLPWGNLVWDQVTSPSCQINGTAKDPFLLLQPSDWCGCSPGWLSPSHWSSLISLGF